MTQALVRWLTSIFGDLIIRLVADWRRDAAKVAETASHIKEVSHAQKTVDVAERGSAADVLERLRTRRAKTDASGRR
jgi:hypothetical protein